MSAILFMGKSMLELQKVVAIFSQAISPAADLNDGLAIEVLSNCAVQHVLKKLQENYGNFQLSHFTES